MPQLDSNEIPMNTSAERRRKKASKSLTTDVDEKVIIVESKNNTPENEVSQRLQELGKGWSIVFAQTMLTPWGEFPACSANGHLPSPLHVLYITTVIVRRNALQPKKKGKK